MRGYKKRVMNRNSPAAPKQPEKNLPIIAVQMFWATEIKN